MEIVRPHLRQVAKISIDVVGPTGDGGFLPPCSRYSEVMFKFSAQETYRVLGPCCCCPDQDEKDDYDGDEVDDLLELDQEEISPTVEQYHGVSSDLFSTATVSECTSILVREISSAISSAVDLDGRDGNCLKRQTLVFLWGKMGDWINSNLDSLKNKSIDKVDVKIEVLTREITDEIGFDDEDGEGLYGEDGLDDELQSYQAYVGEEEGWYRFAPGDGMETSSIEAALRPKQIGFLEMLDGENCCSICMNGEVNDVVQMPCSHVFHNGCIIQWLQQKNSCPLCRFKITSDRPDGV